MDLKISNIDNCAKINLNFDAWKIYSDPKLEVIQIALKPGDKIDSHVNEIDVLFYIVSGNGELCVETEYFQLKTGDCASVPKGLKREWVNNSSENLKLLAIKQLLL